MNLQPQHLPWQAVAVERLPAALRWSVALQRARRWEFWPAWLYYIPIVAWIIALGLRYRSPTLFTAANPLLEAGGVVGERKHEALQPLQDNAPDLVAQFVLLPAGDGSARVAQAQAFADQNGGYPLILKPDVGQRGRGVFIARDAAQVQTYLTRFDGAVIAQRYIEGEEFGVFIARGPDDAEVQILSIVEKTFPAVVGDGRRCLRDLILADARARLIAESLWQRWTGRLDDVPSSGQRVPLVEIGAHCRGALFLDATTLASPALAATLKRLTDAVPGYCFGRLDLRCPSAAHLARGEGLRIIELNGVTAESAHIYHPDTALLTGYAAMFQQWQRAFEIGKSNRARGAKVTGTLELWRRFREDLKRGEHWF